MQAGKLALAISTADSQEQKIFFYHTEVIKSVQVEALER